MYFTGRINGFLTQVTMELCVELVFFGIFSSVVLLADRQMVDRMLM